MHVVLLVLLGMIVGFSLGLIGGGGSILTVPLLVYALGESVAAAIGTSLVVVGVSALIGSLGHWRQHRVAVNTAIALGLSGTVGAVAGTWLVHLIQGRQILFLFALLMLVVAGSMYRGAAIMKSEEAHESRRTTRPLWVVIVTGTAVGVLTGLFGVGGGFVIVPALVIVLRLPMRLAVGTSLLVIAINSAAALISHLQYGGIDLATASLFAIGGSTGALLGTRLAARLQEDRLRQIFAAGLAVVAIYLLVRNHPAVPVLTSHVSSGIGT